MKYINFKRIIFIFNNIYIFEQFLKEIHLVSFVTEILYVNITNNITNFQIFTPKV